MSLTGWLTMIVSIGGVLTAAAWAYYKVLSTPKETEHLAAPPLPCRRTRRNKAPARRMNNSRSAETARICPAHPGIAAAPRGPQGKTERQRTFYPENQYLLPDVFHFS